MGPTLKPKPAKTIPARRSPPNIGRAGAGVFAAVAKKTKFADPQMIGHWPSIAGSEIAALCRPGRITGMKTGRTLEVIAPNGAAAAEVQMRADELLGKVNRYLGPGAVAHIAIRQRNVGKTPQKTAAPTPKGEETSPLGKALSSFRTAVARRNNGPESD